MIDDINTSRRRFLQGSVAAAAGVAFGGSLLTKPVFANEFPRGRIEVLVPFSPGGGTDRSVRLVTPAWQETLGMSEPFRLNHQPGAGTLIAQNALRNATHDGHTVLFTPAPHVAWLSVLQADAFSLDQVAWLGSYFQDPNVLLVPNDSPYQTAQELVDDARESGRTLTASVSSPMSAAHAATVVFREHAGIDIRVVPFDGGAEARNAVAGGHVDLCLAPYWSASNVLELTRALCIFADSDPSTGMWDAPPANDVLDFEMPHLQEPYGALVSTQVKQDHPEVFERLANSFVAALETETFRKAAEEQDIHFFAEVWGPERMNQFIEEYIALLDEYRPAMERDLDEM
ncbi:tripartite tricarboxylate transporter substrate binding protein [Billgrantia desiderata]|uniref:Tripartite tricarboxylate transporter substrate binding protein n=1 Tax=Billgrantia desiderata TaxID=52021 RepID=A0ABS9B9S5_9GAMM|nr:tripartite tricarboxylate transporter substrate binding protein [Halomonas desiderata]MCE8030444.1 tripartite tricarboxylate transporter substrate binding protein [Halomonas desiderata]MCE8044079.1 tripartite tricarboxylate transporter substrate binding protein [Halomonas desiderata]MCE8048653.1 tripartite tricarboxylate transporter substrate binding protein [Halomonas desiderata]